MEAHPVLKDVPPDDFTGPVAQLYSLYRNRPLRSQEIQVILTGNNPRKPAEPVLWINDRGNGKVVYTSMGHWDDWKNEKFRRIMLNSMIICLINERIMKRRDFISTTINSAAGISLEHRVYQMLPSGC